VGGLSEKFMKDMQFAWHLSKKAGYPVLESGRPNFDPAAPMKPMSFTLDRSKLKEEEYAIAAWASHAKGFFELRKLTRPLEVVKYIRMEAIWKPVGFSKKATEGFKKSRWVTLKLKEDIKARQEFVLDLSKIPNRKHLTLRLSNTTPGCKVKDKKITADQVPICLHKANHRVSLSLALRDWTKSRDKDLSFEGEMVLTPKDPEIFKGTKSWKTQTKGKIIAWTFWDWVRFYRNWILLAFGLFVLILWLVGRALAGAFPKKATLYYFDLEDKTDEPSQFALGRRVKSHLPFVSAKHTIGGKGMPRSGKVLCVIRATSGGGFKILPESTVTYERDGEKSEAGEAFRGRYDEHYQAGERYEFWLTRRPSYDD